MIPPPSSNSGSRRQRKQSRPALDERFRSQSSVHTSTPVLSISSVLSSTHSAPIQTSGEIRLNRAATAPIAIVAPTSTHVHGSVEELLMFSNPVSTWEAKEEEEHEHEHEEVEWQWGSPSAETAIEFVAEEKKKEKNNATETMLVDLDAAFSAAFSLDVVPEQHVQKRSHSRGLSTVFASPAVERKSAAPETENAALQIQNQDKRSVQRERIIRELLSSEKVYVENLNKLIDLFYKPLTGKDTQQRKSVSGYLTKLESDMLFGQAEVILLYNTKLYEDLSERLKEGTYDRNTSKISDIFMKMKSFLQVYVYYSENYSKAMKAYEIIMHRNNKTRKLLKSCEREAGNVLESFLILPIQRIPRYILLLKEIVRYTEPSHPDYDNLNETITAIKELCGEINNAPKKLQEANQMLSIYKNMIPNVPDLLSPGRHLVLEERLWIINSDGAVKSRLLFVFNDMLLIVRVDGGRYYLRYRIALKNVEVHDSPPVMLKEREAHIVKLLAKAKEIVMAFKEETSKQVCMKAMEEHNPQIMASSSSFVPLKDREGFVPEKSREEEEEEHNKHLAASTGRLSTLLTRKSLKPEDAQPATATKTKSLSRRMTSKSPRADVGETFEIVRSETSTPQTQKKSIKAEYDIGAIIAQKIAEQKDMQKLLLFYRKCNDSEGVVDVTNQIALYDIEIQELRRKNEKNTQPTNTKQTETKRSHMRNRSLSTSSLPKQNVVLNDVYATPMQNRKNPEAVVAKEEEKKKIEKPIEVERTCVALYDFEGVNEGELSFKAGNVIRLMGKQSDDWCLGSLNGLVGWFPVSFVK